MDRNCHYCIVRADLSRGLQAAQLLHAAGESSPGNLPPGTYAIALQASSEAELRAVADRLESAGIELTRIIENSDKYKGQLMALGLAPRPRSELRRHLSSLPLVK